MEDVTADDWTRSIDVNIRGTVNTVQAAYPILREQRRGAIVAMASLAGLAGLPLLTPYAMTKVIARSGPPAVEAQPDDARHRREGDRRAACATSWPRPAVRATAS